jgi:hypothetical protein
VRDAERVARALAPDVVWQSELRQAWLRVAETAVWGGIESAQLGAVPRLRKRVLELGEKLALLGAPAQWLAAPRERLKSALATALAAQTLLAQCEATLAQLAPGEARDALEAALAALAGSARDTLARRAESWANLLDASTGQGEQE